MIARRCILALVVPSAVAACLRARSYDLWWHLETGEWILRQKAIPRSDPFSFTSLGAPWIDHEWLFQILMQLAHARMGFHGIYLLKMAAVLTASIAAFLVCRRLAAARFSASWTLGWTALAIVGLRPRLAERPEIASFPFVVIVAGLCLAIAARPHRPGGRLGLLAVVTIVWVNLHASALLAPALAAAVAAGVMADALRRRESPRVPLTALALAALTGAGALAFNPWGARIYSLPLELSKALDHANLVNPEWLAPTWSGFPFFFVAALLAVAAGVRALAAGTPMAGPRLALAGLLAGLGFSSIRHIGIFFAALPLLMAPPRWPPSPVPAVAWRGGAAGFGACVLATAWMLLQPPAGSSLGVEPQPGRFPVEAADFADRNLATARLYNDVASGGYLIWRAWPERLVFADGRNEVHAALLQEISTAMDDGAAWRRLLESHQVEGAIVLYRDERIAVREAGTGRLSESTWSELHFPPGEWALVHWDDQAMVFVRRNGNYAPLAAASEYLSIRPEAFRVGLGGVRSGPAGEGAPREIARRLAENPQCRLAKEMAAVYGSDHPPGR